MNTGKEIITKFHSISDAELSLADIQWLIQNIDKAINSVQVEPVVKVNFADIKEIYEKYDIPMDADAEGLQPLYYSGKLLREFIGDLNAYFEKMYLAKFQHNDLRLNLP